MRATVSHDRLHQYLRWLILALFLLPVLSASAQNDNSDVRNFVDSIAKPIYALAWPTATYREFSIDGIESVEGGYNVSVRLSGNSYFGGGDLWVDLIFLIRNWSLADVKIGRDNALLMPAFGTLRAAGAIAKAYAEQQAAEKAAAARAQANPPGQAAQPARLAAGALCIRNPSGADVTFDYHWGTAEPQRYTIKAGDVRVFWWNYNDGPQSSPVFTVSYIDFASGFQQRSYALKRTATVLPVSCSKVQNYSFKSDGSSLILYDVGQSASY